MQFLGFGLGLRLKHYQDIINGEVEVDWFEALTENYFGLKSDSHGPALEKLLNVRERFPIALHGVSLSIGSSDPLSMEYLNKLKNLALMVKPAWISDHLCWTSLGGHNLHDLLPLKYSQKTIEHILPRIHKAQEFLGQRILFENVSSYVEFADSEMPEWEFVAEIAKRSGCGLLLDLNNIHVSGKNHNFDPLKYLEAIPKDAVGQIHLAGACDKGVYSIDTHDMPVHEEVFALYARALEKFGPVNTMVEWDAKIPPYKEVEAEVLKAKKIYLNWKEQRHGTQSAAAAL